MNPEELKKKEYEKPVIDLFAVGKKDILTGTKSGEPEEGELPDIEI